GLDVHVDTIAVAIAEPDGEPRPLGVPNRLESVRKRSQKRGPVKPSYEAGPAGYVLYWQLTTLGVRCEVVAPFLRPVKAGDRVKTDRRDAGQTVAQYRAWRSHPSVGSRRCAEALADLVRAREDAKQDQHRARHRLSNIPAARWPASASKRPSTKPSRRCRR